MSSSSNPFDVPRGIIEQDQNAPAGGGSDDLPSYDDLAAQNGPNSRFGRWRGWIEKRAAERYAEITPEERQRRKERGWELRGSGGDFGSEPDSHAGPPPSILYTNPSPTYQPSYGAGGSSARSNGHGSGTAAAAASLHIQTNNLSLNDRRPISHSAHPSLSGEVQLPFVSQVIPPSHLKINQFGSRFLPHATSPIRCILPLLADRLVLIGHDEGLSVLDMFPQEWMEHGELSVKRPNEAQAHLVWRGETVYQMTILELEETGEGTQQGVVLMLVGPDAESPGSHRDSDFRIIRMYNLSSLTSLARWAVSQKGARPLDLHRPSNWQAQQHLTPTKRHRAQGSIARSIKSLINEHATVGAPSHNEHAATSYHSLLTSPSGTQSAPTLADGAPSGSGRAPSPMRHDSGESTWDVVDELPLRWATDFVPLASPGSRLSSTSVLFYATWSDRKHRSTGGQLLAIATKNSILLYESPKGERAYRFVKDFYTPLQPRSMCFFHQHATQDVSRQSSDSPRNRRHEAEPTTTPISYGIQLCLFVIFDKKAGWIRLADSAVGEVELRDDAGPPSSPRDSMSPSLGSITGRTRARLSFEIRESVAKWILPFQCDLPGRDAYTNSRPVMFLTRGRRTHLVYSPLPTRLASAQPLHVVYWKNTPRQVSARVCFPSRANLTAARYPRDRPPFLQVIAFGDSGLEIYETTLAFLEHQGSGEGSGMYTGNGSGKGKSRVVNYDSSVRAEEDLGGDVGYLQAGGNWDQADDLYAHGLERMDSVSGASFSSVESDDVLMLLKQEAGMYGWCKKGMEDYRIFWVGGTYDDDRDARRSDDSRSLYG